MRLHVVPHINLTHTAEEAAHNLSDHIGHLGRQLPGYELFRAGMWTTLTQRVAEIATPVLIALTLDASTLLDARTAPSDAGR